jgi:periplasmic protein TonB
MKNIILKSSWLLALAFSANAWGQEQLPTHGPNWEGGIEKFRDDVVSKIDRQNIKNQLEAMVEFMVDIDGSLTAIEVYGPDKDFNHKIEKNIQALKSKWTPGTINGKPVRQRVKFPIRIDFQ